MTELDKDEQFRYRIEIPGCRCQELILVTTLLDAHRFRAAQLAELYFRRWGVELHFRQIKIFLGMDVLRCLSPAMVRKELLMHLVAYNLIRALMQRASIIHHVSLWTALLQRYSRQSSPLCRRASRTSRQAHSPAPLVRRSLNYHRRRSGPISSQSQ